MALEGTVGMHTYKEKKQNNNIYNVLKIIRNSYNSKPTVASRPKETGVRFCDTTTIATPIESSHHINKAQLRKMQMHKQTAKKVRGIFPHLVWHTTDKKEEEKQ